MQLALAFIMACHVDSGCTVEGEESVEAEDRSVEQPSKLWGLKIGLAASFIAITVVASFLPSIFMRWRSYEVRGATGNLPPLQA